MKHVKKSVLLWYSPREMYTLVTAVPEYPKFLPWCERGEVLVWRDQSAATPLAATASSSSRVAVRMRRTLPRLRSSSRCRRGPMPGMSASALRIVPRLRCFLWKLTAKRCASSRMRESTKSSAVFCRSTTGSFTRGRNTRSG